MQTVGVRELKAHLSAYLRLARAGERIVITERGRQVAELSPLSPELAAAQRLVEEGRAGWEGGKPGGLQGVEVQGRPVSETLLEDRR